VLTPEDAGLKAALTSSFSLGYSLDLAVFCFLNPIYSISMMLSYFFSFFSSGLLFIDPVFSLLKLFYSFLLAVMLVTDLACGCTVKMVFSSRELALE
jgi:hypothetical protein